MTRNSLQISSHKKKKKTLKAFKKHEITQEAVTKTLEYTRNTKMISKTLQWIQKYVKKNIQNNHKLIQNIQKCKNIKAKKKTRRKHQKHKNAPETVNIKLTKTA